MKQVKQAAFDSGLDVKALFNNEELVHVEFGDLALSEKEVKDLVNWLNTEVLKQPEVEQPKLAITSTPLPSGPPNDPNLQNRRAVVTSPILLGTDVDPVLGPGEQVMDLSGTGGGGGVAFTRPPHWGGAAKS